MSIQLLTEKISACPACGSNSFELWDDGYDRLHRTTSQQFEYSRCNGCHALFQSIRPVQEEIWKCYPDQYGPYAQSHNKGTLTRLPKRINQFANKLAERLVGVPRFCQEISEIEKHLKKSKKMLDFGCGAGKYLDRARKFGCETIGMDFSNQALAQVRSRGHMALSVDGDSWDTLGNASIDFVRMNHVVEHLYQPAEILRKIFNAMAPEGVLHLSTPNPSGPSSTRYRSAWWGLECPRHIVLMPPETTVNLLVKAGFHVIQVLHEPITKDYVRSWAYSRVDQGKMENDMVEGLAGDGLLNLLFAPKIISAHRQHQATDRYHVVARKP